MFDQPPKWAIRFLEKTCSPKFLDELQGDLFELFDRDVSTHGIRKARKRFVWKTLLSVRWYRLPGLNQFQFLGMWKNHFKMAYRHAFKHKSSSAINFLGLMFGVAAVFYISLYLKDQLTYDTMHANGEQLYRVLRSNPSNGERTIVTSSQHGKVLAEEFPYISMCSFGNDPVKMGDVNPRLVDEFYWADSTFFELFSFPLLHGNPQTCLDETNSLVISQSLSKQLFGTEKSLGKILKVKVYDGDQEFQMKITGVVADVPKHSHIQFQALGSMANAEVLYKRLVGSWGFSWLRTYIQVPDQRISEIETSLPNLIDKHLGEEASKKMGMSFQPFLDVYLGSQDIQRNTLKGDIKFLYIFAAIGCLILLISMSNYINLATARAVTRAKEVGVRKVLGTKKSGIISQFIVESLFFTLGAGIIAILFMVFFLPHFNTLLDLELSYKLLTFSDWSILFIGLFILGIIAGLLPALSMAKLGFPGKGKSSIHFKPNQRSLTRKLFIGVQYLVTLVLLVSTFVIFKQYVYLKNFDLGFDSSQLMHISVDDRLLQQKLHTIKDKIIQLPGVKGVTTTGEDLPSKLNNTWGLKWPGSNPEQSQGIDVVGVDKNYFDLMQIDFVSGGNFTHEYSIDSAFSVVINERAHNIIGLKNLVGQQISIGGRDRKVIGIVEDHHNTTLHSQTIPLAFFIFPPGTRESPDNILVKFETTDLTPLIGALEKTWGAFTADPFEFNFVDDAFAKAYQKERKFSRLVSSFTVIAILISLIGLFGLISFTTQLKVKEISIRRILGATEFNLMKILGKEFIAVFLIALIIAIPLAYYLMQSWLTNYAYHIQLNGWFLILPALVCLSISVLVIFYHLRRTASRSPGEVLSVE